ncbi:MAG: AmmeMemoRadiSam system protein B [bacterium]
MRAINSGDIRAPAVAGMFYPEDTGELRRNVATLLEAATPRYSDLSIVAAIAPHAGYMYSGSVAAYTFKTLQARFATGATLPPTTNQFSPTAVVIAPSHREIFPYISVFTGHAYRTPLGEVPVARELAAALVAADEYIMADWRGHLREHALEVELPFLQVIWPQVRLVPVVMGQQDWELCKLLGEHLAALARETSMLILASSDLSHYLSYDKAVETDARFIEHLRAFDPEALHYALEEEVCQACGGGPVVAAMLAARALGADTADILRYQNSGDISGDRSTVVGYVAATFGVSSGTKQGADRTNE